MPENEEIDFHLEGCDPDLVEAEIEHQLYLKGYCVIGSVVDEDLLIDAFGDLKALKAEGRFEPPPEQIIGGLLGADGSGEMASLMLPDEPDYAEGDKLQRIDEGISGLAENCARFMSSLGFTATLRSPSKILRGGISDFSGPPLTEETCSHWITTFNQGKLMIVLFGGPNDGTLELQPFGDDESGVVEINTRPGSAVIFRCDRLSRRHFSSSMDYTFCCWITSPETMTGPRGWLSTNTSVAKDMPVAKALEDWARERLEELYSMELSGNLDESTVPRDWLRTMHHQYFRQSHDPVAVRGQAGHVPGEHDNELVWKSMNWGVDLLQEVPLFRWDHSLYFDEDPNSWMKSQFFAGGITKTAVRHCSFIEGIEFFDNKFFGLSLMEAKGMDPMQRHSLEVSYECLHNAGMRKKAMMGSFIAVYTGSAHPEWSYVHEKMDEFSITAASQAMLSTRTSYMLGLKGPSISIDCDMASAAMGIMSGANAVSQSSERKTESGQDCDGACCGGVYFALSPVMWPRHGAFMDAKGRCFTFDATANGYVRGEMCGSVFLTPNIGAGVVEGGKGDLFEEFIYGTLAGWRMSNSGRGASLTAPCGPAEQAACREAVHNAGIDALDVDGFECHGIAGLLPDGVEVTSVASVLRGGLHGDRETLLLSSAKSHVGAQCEASGMIQFIKVLFNILYGTNTPSLHLRQLNPHLTLGRAAVVMNNEQLAYRDRSAFHQLASRGWGGTNVNLVVWYSCDKTKVAVNRPEMERQDFAFWPGGGGSVESVMKPSEGYFIVGSWSSKAAPQEMEKVGQGCYRCTVTLGLSSYETFQIWIDGEEERVLHPEVSNAPSGSVVIGPSFVREAEGFSWKIDGRDPSYPVDASLALEDSTGVGLDRRQFAYRDTGKPGDQYEVQLLIAGKYQAVTWRKTKSAEAAQITEKMVAGSYYIVGSFNDWTFQEMEPSADVPGLYTAEVGPLPRRGGEFQISRNKDWDQMFHPTSSFGASGEEVIGPDDTSTGLNWCLRPPTYHTDVFKVEFRRTLEQGKDVRSLTWATSKR